MPGRAVYVLDIEGTTTPLSFVKDILFPYVEQNLERFLAEQPTCYADLLPSFRAQALADRDAGAPPIPTSSDTAEEDVRQHLVANIRWQMARDQKTTALKELQGRIWADGYATGNLVGFVYEDVNRALRRIKSNHAAIFIYSSGSIQAQKLLFGHSDYGDLTEFLDGHFDTTIGAKTDPQSYARIQSRVEAQLGTADLVFHFLSDNPKEVDAARQAGMHAQLVVRPGNTPLPEEYAQEPTLHDFDSLA